MELGVEAMGAITPVGDNLPLSAASIYTNARRYQALATVGVDGRAVIGAPTLIGDDVQGVDRLRVLAMLALQECGVRGGEMDPESRGAASLPVSAPLPLPLIVCAPALELFGCDADWLLRRMAEDADLPIDRDASRVLASGRGDLSGALDVVARLLLLREWPACLLLGVDSLVASERLVREVASGRVAGPRNVTGFVPGEAAAAVRLSLRGQGDTDDDDGCPAIIAGRGHCVGGAEPGASASALAEAADRALAAAGLPAAALGAVCHDGSGDWGQLEELALADRKPPLALAPQAQRFMPAISTGEVGAAAGVLSLAFLSLLLSKGVLSQPALAMFSSDGAARGAAVLVPASSDAGTPLPIGRAVGRATGRAAGRANDGGQE